jgi:probable phosphoglycerate mutase
VITAYIDGGARGNPGPAGYGVHIESPDGSTIDELHGGLGVATNNVAEYNGLLAALRYALDRGHRDVRIKADSELLVKQMRGEYRVKHPGLQPLYQEARSLVARLGRVTFEHVRREFNKHATEGNRWSGHGRSDTSGGWCSSRCWRLTPPPLSPRECNARPTPRVQRSCLTASASRPKTGS